jgi:hypothetical protein
VPVPVSDVVEQQVQTGSTRLTRERHAEQDLRAVRDDLLGEKPVGQSLLRSVADTRIESSPRKREGTHMPVRSILCWSKALKSTLVAAMKLPGASMLHTDLKDVWSIKILSTMPLLDCSL